MEKVLEKKVVKRVVSTVDPSLKVIEKLTVLNGSLTEQVKKLSTELDEIKVKVDQVASRLGL